MKARKIPETINYWPVAQLIDQAKNDFKSLPRSIRDAYAAGDLFFMFHGIDVRTHDGIVRVDPVDMMIEGASGEISICRIEKFLKTYEVLPE